MAQADKTLLTFWFLVERRESDRWGTTYGARSILTGDVAEARTPDAAVENLKRTIEVAIQVAGRYGQAPRDWWAEAQSQEMLRPETLGLLETFARSSDHSLTALPPIDSCDMRATVVLAA